MSEFELRIPSKRPESVLTGTVVWADGSPVVDAQLVVKDETYHEQSVNHGVAANEQGQFKINGYSGQKLVIEARSSRPAANESVFGPMERSESLPITLERPTHTVRIVITKLR